MRSTLRRQQEGEAVMPTICQRYVRVYLLAAIALAEPAILKRLEKWK